MGVVFKDNKEYYCECRRKKLVRGGVKYFKKSTQFILEFSYFL